MKSIKAALGRFNKREKKIERLTTAQKKDFGKLFPHVRALILRKIYEQAKGVFPHKFDPVVLRRDLARDGHLINPELFFETVERLGPRGEKCEVEEGSFNIEHHYCLGRVKLR